MRTYIAGPMGGFKNLNFDAFDSAWVKLTDDGYAPISPVDIDRVHESWEKYPPEGFVMTREFLVRVMLRDFAVIPSCDAVYMLNGWEDSWGATAEHAFAKRLGLEILYQGG